MKKIVHVIIGLNVGGAELMLKRLILNNKNPLLTHEVISLTDLGVIGKDLQESGIKISALNMFNILAFPKTFLKLKKIFNQDQPDIVQTWMYHADFIGGLAAKAAGVNNIIWGIRTTDVSAGRSKVTVALRKMCAWLSYYVPSTIICAAEAARKVHEQIGYDPTKMIVIPNGFELDKLQATEHQRILLRGELKILDSEIVIGSVGRFNPIKNQKLFIEMASLLNQKYSFLKFMIVGRDNNSQNKELMGWIESQNLTDKVILLGERKDIPVCLKAMDIFCLHSKTEGFPNALGEAMALRLPCVALDVGDSKYLLNSSFCVPTNLMGLVNALYELCIDSSLRDIEAQKNVLRIKDFSMKEFYKKIEELY